MYPLYNSYAACATSGFVSGITLVRELGEQEINSKKIMLNFRCQEMVML